MKWLQQCGCVANTTAEDGIQNVSSVSENITYYFIVQLTILTTSDHEMI